MVDAHELSLWRCQAVLRAGGVGRIAFSAPDGSHLVPVNYSVVDQAIIIRTASNSLLARHGGDRPVAFEVDHVDYTHQRACSVIAISHGSLLERAPLGNQADTSGYVGSGRPSVSRTGGLC